MEWKLPRSYRYLLRKYGKIVYFDMEGTWSFDWDDIHDEADESVREEFEGAVFFQKMNGPYVAGSYCFMINSAAGNSEVEIKEFPHDDSPTVCGNNFAHHLYEYFSDYFY